METKECKTCKENKETSEFYSQAKRSKSRGEYIYYHPECKSCAIKKSTKWMSDNYHKYREYQNEYARENKEYKKIRAIRTKESGRVLIWARKNKDKIRGYNIRRQNKIHEIFNQEWTDCKIYFNNSCAYCEMTVEEHYKVFNQDLHREHVDHEGANDLSNCVAACKSCNSSKRTSPLEEWYNEENENYTEVRMNKIGEWLFKDYMNYIA